MSFSPSRTYQNAGTVARSRTSQGQVRRQELRRSGIPGQSPPATESGSALRGVGRLNLGPHRGLRHALGFNPSPPGTNAQAHEITPAGLPERHRDAAVHPDPPGRAIANIDHLRRTLIRPALSPVLAEVVQVAL